MKKRELTCIVCPRGCQLSVELDKEGKVLSIEGNACRRGVTYAEAECPNPQRTVTSTVKCVDGGIVSCKTESPVPKGKVFEVMREINSARALAGVSIGDVLIENVANTGVSVIATSNMVVD